MRLVVGLLGLALAGCATAPARATSQGAWCATDFLGPATDWTELPQARISMVAPDRLNSAAARLRNASVVPLTAAQSAELTGESRTPQGRYYLVRTGIVAAPGAPQSAYFRVASEDVRRLVYWNAGESRLLIVTFQMWRGEREIFEIPLIVETTVTPRSASSVCHTVN